MNHLAHQLLVTRLCALSATAAAPSAVAARCDGSRVVVLSSWMPARYSFNGPRDTGGLVHHNASSYPFFLPGAYGMSKQASIRFARALRRRYSSIHTYSLHPGLISTGLGVKRGDSWLATLEKFGADSWWRLASLFVLVKTIEEGAATTVFCAVAREAAAESGLFYDNAKVLTGAYISASVGMRAGVCVCVRARKRWHHANGSSKDASGTVPRTRAKHVACCSPSHAAHRQ